MVQLKLFFLCLLISSCCAVKYNVSLQADSKWRDVFANQSGTNISIEITKLTGVQCVRKETDSTKIRLVSVRIFDGEPNAQLPNPLDDGITFTGILDLTLDGSTKIINVPTGIKIIGLSSQNCSIIKIKKRILFFKQLKNK